MESPCPLCMMCHQEQARGRDERRTVEVFPAPPEMSEAWKGSQWIIFVTRQVARNGQETVPHTYYISSIASDDAEVFAAGVRGHWSIEDCLHWVKDVIQHEDDAGIRKGNGGKPYPFSKMWR